MELSEIYQEKFGNNSLKISFEIYPPANNDISSLYEELRILKRFEPALISLAQSSKGGVYRFSYEDMKSIRDLEFEIVPQISCINCIKNEIEKQITNIENLGIENIIVKMGEIPDYIKKEELDFCSCHKLIEYLKAKTTLSVGLISSVEDFDFNNIKKEIETGADAIFTTPFKNNNKFYSYINNLRKQNINIPIIAGISTDMNMEECIKKCKDLIEFGISGLHLYTNNRSNKIVKILENIL